MIIDFRLRPPAHGFESLNLFGPGKGPEGPIGKHNDIKPVLSAYEFSMPLFLDEMKEAGVDKGVVMGRDTKTRGVRNDDIAALVKEYPDLFIPFGAVDIGKGIVDSTLEVERCVRHLGFRGMVLEPGTCDPPIRADAPQAYPFYERCAELGAIVAVSFSPYLGPNVTFANPTALQTVARDFPRTKFVIAHSAFPYALEAISVAAVQPNVYLNLDDFLTHPAGPGRELFAKGICWLEGRKMLFGTAYPFLSLKQSIESIQELGLPKIYYDRFMYQNALKLLEL